MRLFVALLLEPPLLDALALLQSQLQRLDASRSVRWVDPRGIHLTLKFLGEVPEARLDALGGAVGRAVHGQRSPMLTLGGSGAFPNTGRPRVLWVGVRESGRSLHPLASAVENAMADLGFAPERRVFQPHLTLGRVRDAARPGETRWVAAALDGLAVPKAVDVRHPRVALMQSHLGPSGARYEEMRRWDLE